MEKILKVHNVNDYARYIGAPELHPLVSVIHYDELEHCRHSLNSYQVYGIILLQESPYRFLPSRMPKLICTVSLKADADASWSAATPRVAIWLSMRR